MKVSIKWSVLRLSVVAIGAHGLMVGIRIENLEKSTCPSRIVKPFEFHNIFLKMELGSQAFQIAKESICTHEEVCISNSETIVLLLCLGLSTGLVAARVLIDIISDLLDFGQQLLFDIELEFGLLNGLSWLSGLSLSSSRFSFRFNSGKFFSRTAETFSSINFSEFGRSSRSLVLGGHCCRKLFVSDRQNMNEYRKILRLFNIFKCSIFLLNISNFYHLNAIRNLFRVFLMYIIIGAFIGL